MPSSPPKLNGNVLPENFRGRRLTGREILLLLALLVLIALIIPVYNVTSSASRYKSDLEKQRDELSQQLLLKLERDKVSTQMYSVINQYQIIESKREVLTEDLEAIISAAGQVGLDVTSVTHPGEGETITVSGELPAGAGIEDYSTVLQNFTEALLQTERFSSAEYSITEYPLAPPTITIGTAPNQGGS